MKFLNEVKIWNQYHHFHRHFCHFLSAFFCWQKWASIRRPGFIKAAQAWPLPPEYILVWKWNSFPQNSRRTPLWDIFDERESTDSFDNEDEEMVTFELSEMLLMLLAAGTDDEVTDSEDEWDLFHEELDDFYEIYL